MGARLKARKIGHRKYLKVVRQFACLVSGVEDNSKCSLGVRIESLQG